MKTKLTLKSVRAELSALVVTIAKDSAGEYKVRIKGDTRGNGYFTPDLDDALATGKLSVTGSQWIAAIHGKDDAEKDVVALVSKVKTLRQNAKAWSEVQTALNLTDASRQQLYMIVKDLAKDKAKDFAPAA